ncbi:short-chain dehydrogenase [Pigmentiphaga sp. NML080357]|uniref:SDR family NAD(P)-dependent oxidoreductase n=1 Tax=Pigmentiphaga sp. NML080357 TaxID=2008675 RepID=UPI000B40C9B3|nr:SDR family NAD(P)-dependent oxidoreductase [Pigmentiphaga sp. NML080357]OVZ55203.1 short-chain dehydrogenase [Pigmentiphaga sp. NML080357]
MNMKDQVCIVTGGAGSLGLHSALAMLDQGARVLLVDRHAEALETARLQAAVHGDRVAVFAADVTDAAQTRGYVEEALRRWGRLDVLVCNAGINGAIKPIADYPDDVFDAVMAVNVKGTFLACKHALPRMADGGSIVIVSSVMGVTADPGVCAYAASKHALVGLMRVAAKEAAGRGIRVNVVAPGPIANAFQADIERRLGEVLGRDATRMLDEAIPLGRHARVEEIAQTVLFLASPQGSFSTGSVFMADGGMHV